MKKTNILDADGWSPHVDKVRRENIKADVIHTASLGVREYIPTDKRELLYQDLISGKAMPKEYFISKPKEFHGSPGHIYQEWPEEFISGLEMVIEEDNKKLIDSVEAEKRIPKQEGGAVDEQINSMLGVETMPEEVMPEEVMPEEALVEQEMIKEELIPDEQMEQNFVDFVVDEALTDEEESILEEQLEANPELSLIFDKVLEKASEFTGAGLVNGPGTGTSDDIPARLSDGEFVFTAKAVEEIGVDNLTSMMKEAEVRADNRQGMANGGAMYKREEVQKSSPIYGAKVKQDSTIPNEIKEGMVGNNPLDPRHRYYQ